MRHRHRLGVVALTTVFVTSSVFAQTVAARAVTEWSTETRIALSFHVADSVVARLLPAGWTSAPSTTATNAGANLTVTFVERLFVQDGQGKPYRTGTSRYIVFGAPARNAAGESNTVILTGISPEGSGAYGVYVTASTSRAERAARAKEEEGGRAEERWKFAAPTGEKVELELAYRRGTPVKSHVTTTIRSALHPEQARRYVIDQLVDVVHGLAMPDRVDALKFKATGPAFAALFNGQEKLLSVTSIPWYVREISVP